MQNVFPPLFAGLCRDANLSALIYIYIVAKSSLYAWMAELACTAGLLGPAGQQQQQHGQIETQRLHIQTQCAINCQKLSQHCCIFTTVYVY